MHIKNRKRCKAFSLLELLAVITLLGIIAVVVIPRIAISSSSAKLTADRQNIAEINSAVERYYWETGNWPANDLSDIKANLNYFPQGIPTCPVDGSTYALDPTTKRVTGHSHTSNSSGLVTTTSTDPTIPTPLPPSPITGGAISTSGTLSPATN